MDPKLAVPSEYDVIYGDAESSCWISYGEFPNSETGEMMWLWCVESISKMPL